MYAAKSLLRQARPLFVPEVRGWEDIVLEDSQSHTVVIAGYLLFCIMGVSGLVICCTVQDCQCPGTTTVLVEAGTSVHKTAHTKKRKTMLLPIMELGRIFHSKKSWGERWVQTMNRQLGGRVNITPLQVSIHDMLQNIGKREWGPDCSRVERLDKQIELTETLADLDQDLEGAVFGPFRNPAIDLGELETAVETDDQVEKIDAERVFIAAEKADGRLMQHNLSGVLHFLGVEDKFVCGRPVSALYGMVDVDLSHQWPVCQQCRRVIGEDVLSTFVGA
eukprot:s3778_g12.t1